MRLHGTFELYLHHLEEGRLEYRYVVTKAKKNTSIINPEQIGRSDQTRRYLFKEALKQHYDKGSTVFFVFIIRLLFELSVAELVYE